MKKYHIAIAAVVCLLWGCANPYSAQIQQLDAQYAAGQIDAGYYQQQRNYLVGKQAEYNMQMMNTSANVVSAGANVYQGYKLNRIDQNTRYRPPSGGGGGPKPPSGPPPGGNRPPPPR
jgi:hypothetical protein